MRRQIIRRRKRPAKKREIFRGIDFNEVVPKKPVTLLEKVQAKKAVVEDMLKNRGRVFLCPACIGEYHLGQLAHKQISMAGQFVKKPCAFCGKVKPCEIRGA